MVILDISPLISPRLTVWPGDEPFRVERTMQMAQGDPVNLSTLHSTAHLGAHADAPLHVLRDGDDIASMALEPFIGPCEVIEVALPPASAIGPEHLPGPLRAPRVLFKTRQQTQESFATDFCALSIALVTVLKQQGCVLAGIDTPSMDLFEMDLDVHRTLLGNGIAILENLDLSHVEPGLYTLVALPLRIEGGDGSPVRAVLVQD